MNLAELLTIPAELFPERELIRFEGAATTYGALADRVGRAAGAMRGLGVGRGDRVAVLDVNTPGAVAAGYAAAALGASWIPLNYRARAPELAEMLRLTTPRLLLVGQRYLELARMAAAAAQPSAQLLLFGPSSASTEPGFDALVAQAEPIAPVEVEDSDIAILMFTSGTSAHAKAVMLGHGQLANSVLGSTELASDEPAGVVLLSAPLYHIAGLTALLTATFAGRRIVLLRQFDATQWLHAVEHERATTAFLVPTMLRQVLNRPEFSSTDLSSLTTLSYGAAPMPLGLIRSAITAFPKGVQFINAFGQTETASTVTVLAPEDHRLTGSEAEIEQKVRRLGSVGRPLPGVTLRIVDESGNDLPAGTIGEVAISSEQVMRGYFGADDSTKAALAGEWLLTRDLGWVDDAGYLFLAGRKSDLIIRGGENVSPEEIESVLDEHPAVDEVAAFGMPDEEWGERIGAAVVRRSGIAVTEEELIAFSRERLASFKKPESIFFVERLPRSAIGKLLRRELRERYGGRTTRR